MFLHVIAVDRQLSVHAGKDKPLSRAVDEAFRFHGRKRTAELVATAEDGRPLDLAKSAEANGLSDNEVVRVGLPAPVEVEEEAPVEAPAPRARAPKAKAAPKPRPVQGQPQARRQGFGTTAAPVSETEPAQPSAIERRMAAEKNAAPAPAAPTKTTTKKGKR